MTYSELYDLVESDTENSKLKEIAELFLTAMNDWPTYNLEEIDTFLLELKEYFGNPLTLDKISSKEFQNVNAWKHESGSSIAEMIEYSKLYYNETDFDVILDLILNNYKQ